jgi:hypothetical protein
MLLNKVALHSLRRQNGVDGPSPASFYNAGTLVGTCDVAAAMGRHFRRLTRHWRRKSRECMPRLRNGLGSCMRRTREVRVLAHDEAVTDEQILFRTPPYLRMLGVAEADGATYRKWSLLTTTVVAWLCEDPGRPPELTLCPIKSS